eukprot:COSAG03_NODE_26214_length_260_cov_1.291925_1_plen_42_part_01
MCTSNNHCQLDSAHSVQVTEQVRLFGRPLSRLRVSKPVYPCL